MSNSITQYNVTITRENNYASAEVTSPGGEEISAECLFEMARAIDVRARVQINKENSSHLIMDRCYVYRTKFGLKYFQYKGFDISGILVLPIEADGCIKEGQTIQHYMNKAKALTEMAVQPTLYHESKGTPVKQAT